MVYAKRRVDVMEILSWAMGVGVSGLIALSVVGVWPAEKAMFESGDVEIHYLSDASAPHSRSAVSCRKKHSTGGCADRCGETDSGHEVSFVAPCKA